jgi:hypothetical protein
MKERIWTNLFGSSTLITKAWLEMTNDEGNPKIKLSKPKDVPRIDRCEFLVIGH